MMLRKFFSFMALTGSLAAVAVSCSPYEDGPDISFRSREERLKSTWQYESLLENGNNVTARVDSQFIAIEGSNVLTITWSDTTGTYTQEGYWYLINNDEDLEFYYDNPRVTPERDTFQIMRLKEKELWLRQEKDGDVWDIRLIPVDSLQ